ncbi:hypothetical protein TNCV_980621 [Trichonephila clavipes]|uniref:Uncharacterized protein n=1 Tax=Trichonephila clavipes TaxID=2585209 RepID=A0A8X6S548_TRICX|nr:hypothetical protein TNCV_980621 [Trichonephila clavipes]
MLNDDEIVTSLHEESDPVDEEMEEDKDNNNNENSKSPSNADAFSAQNQIKVREVKRRPLFIHLYICSASESREEKARHGGGFKWITLEKHMKIPEGSELANKVTNDAKMVAKVAKWTAKNDANLALPPRFHQVLIQSPL